MHAHEPWPRSRRRRQDPSPQRWKLHLGQPRHGVGSHPAPFLPRPPSTARRECCCAHAGPFLSVTPDPSGASRPLSPLHSSSPRGPQQPRASRHRGGRWTRSEQTEANGRCRPDINAHNITVIMLWIDCALSGEEAASSLAGLCTTIRRYGNLRRQGCRGRMGPDPASLTSPYTPGLGPKRPPCAMAERHARVRP